MASLSILGSRTDGRWLFVHVRQACRYLFPCIPILPSYLYVCMCVHYSYQQTVQFTECNKRGIPWALRLGRIPYQTASSMCELPFAEDPLGDQ